MESRWPIASDFLSPIMCQCLCHNVGGKIISKQPLGNEQQMSHDHLVSVADAACAPTGTMSDISWPENVCRRVNQTGHPSHPPIVHNVLAVVPPAHCKTPAELLEVSIWEWIHVWHLDRGGKGLCLLCLHTSLELLM